MTEKQAYFYLLGMKVAEMELEEELEKIAEKNEAAKEVSKLQKKIKSLGTKLPGDKRFYETIVEDLAKRIDPTSKRLGRLGIKALIEEQKALTKDSPITRALLMELGEKPSRFERARASLARALRKHPKLGLGILAGTGLGAIGGAGYGIGKLLED